MTKKLCVLFSILCLWHTSGLAQTSDVRFFMEGFLQRAAVEGTVQWSDADMHGTEIDLDSTLRFDDITSFAGRLGVILHQKHEVVWNYRRYQFAESVTLKSALQFAGTIIPADFPISADLTVQTIGLYYGYRLVDAPEGFLAIRSGVEFVRHTIDLGATLFGIHLRSLDYTDDQALPFVFLVGEFRIHPRLALGGEMSGGWWHEHAAYLFQPMLKVYGHPQASASIGYSLMWYKHDVDYHLLDTTLSGPFIGVQVLW